MKRRKSKKRMPISPEAQELFQDLQRAVEWEGRFLSDLRFDKRLLLRSLRALQPRQYPTRAWLKLIRYLLSPRERPSSWDGQLRGSRPDRTHEEVRK